MPLSDERMPPASSRGEMSRLVHNHSPMFYFDHQPNTFQTHGRIWPVLAGERGEYELAAGDTTGARAALLAMAMAGNDAYLLPEQVWDNQPPSGRPGFPPGKGTFSATPLGWSPAILVPLHHHVINKPGYPGDHKGPPNPSQPPSPLRIARLLGQAKGSISLYTTLVHLLKLDE